MSGCVLYNVMYVALALSSCRYQNLTYLQSVSVGCTSVPWDQNLIEPLRSKSSMTVVWQIDRPLLSLSVLPRGAQPHCHSLECHCHGVSADVKSAGYARLGARLGVDSVHIARRTSVD